MGRRMVILFYFLDTQESMLCKHGGRGGGTVYWWGRAGGCLFIITYDYLLKGLFFKEEGVGSGKIEGGESLFSGLF